MVTQEVSLVIQNPTEGKFLKHIDWNKEEFLLLVTSITKQYDGAVYSDEEIKDAKSDRAKLNAMKKAISERRIQVKKEVMEPYNQFESEVAEVVKLIEGPINMIDKQIKEYEDSVKIKKQKNLTDYFHEIASDLDGILTFDMIFDQRYLNITITLAKAKSDIMEKVGKARTDLQTIDSIDSEFRINAKDIYIKTLDMSKAMAEVTRLQEFKKKAEAEKLRKDEEVRKAAMADEAGKSDSVKKVTGVVDKKPEVVIESIENESKTTETVPIPAQTVTEPIQNIVSQPSGDFTVLDPFFPQEDSKRYKASFTVLGTKAQIMALKKYMIDNNIEFGKAGI